MEIEQKNEIYDCNWRWTTNEDDPLAPLLLFIKTKKLHPGLTKHQLIINALTAFYLPQAYQSFGDNSPEEQIRLAYDAIAALTSHIHRLRHEYSLPTTLSEAVVGNTNTLSINVMETDNSSLDDDDESNISTPSFLASLSTTINEENEE